MSCFRRCAVAVATLTLALCGCGADDTDATPSEPFAILSAFPAEIAPHIERAKVTETMVIDGHVFRVGVLEGVPVVLAMTGIGLVNATMTTRVLLERFAVQGIVVSGVAGASQLLIGDVAVPLAWATSDGTTYTPPPEWLELSEEIAAAGLPLEQCTRVPAASEEPVCLSHEPAVVVGGVGRSSDPFGNQALRCRVGGGDVFGCDTDTLAAASASARRTMGVRAPGDVEFPIVDDMETAAIAREAAARGVPFIAFRAVSDGPGDPLGLPNFLAQFNAYYSLAARNAAAATVAFLTRVVAGR